MAVFVRDLNQTELPSARFVTNSPDVVNAEEKPAVVAVDMLSGCRIGLKARGAWRSGPIRPLLRPRASCVF